MEICPFNPAHEVKPMRFQNHLQKCEQQHTGKGFTRCIFNATHIIKIEDKVQHLKECEDASDEIVFKLMNLINSGREKYSEVYYDASTASSDKNVMLDGCTKSEICNKVEIWLKDTLNSSAATDSTKIRDRFMDKPTMVVKSASPHCPPPLRKARHFIEKTRSDQSEVEVSPDDSISNVGVMRPKNNKSTNQQVSDGDNSESSGSSEVCGSLVSNPKSSIKIVPIKNLIKSILSPPKKQPDEGNKKSLECSASAASTNKAFPSSNSGASPEGRRLVPFDIKSIISDCDSFASAETSQTRPGINLKSPYSLPKKPSMSSVAVQTEGLCNCDPLPNVHLTRKSFSLKNHLL